MFEIVVEQKERYKPGSLRRYGEDEPYNLRYKVKGKVRTLKAKHTGGWIWKTEVYYGDVKVGTNEYYTDKNGHGLWRNDKQVLGTCQYHAPRSRSGMLKRIIRELEAIDI